MKSSKVQSLSEAARRLQAIIDTAIDGIITIDEQGIIETVNPALSRLFGYSQEELVGENVKILMPSPDRERHDGYIANYMRTGEAKIIGIGREVTGKRKDGTEFPFRLAVGKLELDDKIMFTGIVHDLSAVKDAEMEILKLNQELEAKVEHRTEELASVVNRLLKTNQQLKVEVTERKKTEDILRRRESELNEALEKEKELSELKSRFVSMASHEFRTPLSTILSSAALIQKYTESGQQENREKHINRIKSSVGNLNNILNDILSLTKLEEGVGSLNLEEFTMEKVGGEILEEMGVMLKPGQTLDFEGDLDIPAELDKAYLKNILYNLISNAFKYSGPDQPIRILVKELDEHLQIQVIDAGMGIPEKEQKHLFERFYRATNVANIQGTGLGLTIVKHYLDLMHGEISFHSKLGEGTTFTVILPKRLG